MNKTILFCLLIFSFKQDLCNGISVKDIGDTISKISNELGISGSEMQSDDSNVDICPQKCSNQISELRKNMTELYMAFLALHAELAHLSQHIIFHEKALKHIAIWGHQQYHHKHHSSHNSSEQNIREHNTNSTDDEQSEDMKVTKNFSHHNHHNHHHNHNEEDSKDSQNLKVNTNDMKSDEPNNDRKDSSEESSEEQNWSGKQSILRTTANMPTVSPDFSDNEEMSRSQSKSPLSDEPIHSTDSDFKKWFDKMLKDMHKNRKNPIHIKVIPKDNDSEIHSHHIHIHSNSDSETQKRKEFTEEMEKAITSEELVLATCEVRPNRHIALLNQQDIRGRINLWQQKANRGPLHMHIKLKGFKVANHEHRPPTREVRETVLMPVEQEPDDPTPAQSQAQRLTVSHSHGFHVHENGNLTRDCQSVGGHYNPLNLTHGGPYDVIRHVGDLGNIHCDENGEMDTELTFSQVSLSGEHSIINRSLVIHHNIDDYGRNPKNPASLMTGSSGIRIACCTIEEVKTLPNEADSQSKVGAVAGPLLPNKRRRDVSERHHFEDIYLSEIYKKFANFENRLRFQTLLERTSRKDPNLQ